MPQQVSICDTEDTDRKKTDIRESNTLKTEAHMYRFVGIMFIRNMELKGTIRPIISLFGRVKWMPGIVEYDKH